MPFWGWHHFPANSPHQKKGCGYVNVHYMTQQFSLRRKANLKSCLNELYVTFHSIIYTRVALKMVKLCLSLLLKSELGGSQAKLIKSISMLLCIGMWLAVTLHLDSLHASAVSKDMYTFIGPALHKGHIPSSVLSQGRQFMAIGHICTFNGSCSTLAGQRVFQNFPFPLSFAEFHFGRQVAFNTMLPFISASSTPWSRDSYVQRYIQKWHTVLDPKVAAP